MIIYGWKCSRLSLSCKSLLCLYPSHTWTIFTKTAISISSPCSDSTHADVAKHRQALLCCEVSLAAGLGSFRWAFWSRTCQCGIISGKISPRQLRVMPSLSVIIWHGMASTVEWASSSSYNDRCDSVFYISWVKEGWWTEEDGQRYERHSSIGDTNHRKAEGWEKKD